MTRSDRVPRDPGAPAWVTPGGETHPCAAGVVSTLGPPGFPRGRKRSNRYDVPVVNLSRCCQRSPGCRTALNLTRRVPERRTVTTRLAHGRWGFSTADVSREAMSESSVARPSACPACHDCEEVSAVRPCLAASLVRSVTSPVYKSKGHFSNAHLRSYGRIRPLNGFLGVAPRTRISVSLGSCQESLRRPAPPR